MSEDNQSAELRDFCGELALEFCVFASFVIAMLHLVAGSAGAIDVSMVSGISSVPLLVRLR